MCTEYTDEYKQEIIRKFPEDVRNYYQQVKSDYDEFTNNKDIPDPEKSIKDKYPWLRVQRFTKRSVISNFKTTIKDLFNVTRSSDCLDENNETSSRSRLILIG